MHTNIAKLQAAIKLPNVHRTAGRPDHVHHGVLSAAARQLRSRQQHARARRQLLCMAERQQKIPDGRDKSWEELLSAAAEVTRDIGTKLGESAKEAASSAFSGDRRHQRQQSDPSPSDSERQQQQQPPDFDLGREVTRALESGLQFASTAAGGLSSAADGAFSGVRQAVQDGKKMWLVAQVAQAALEVLQDDAKVNEVLGGPIAAAAPADARVFETVSDAGRKVEVVEMSLPIRGSKGEGTAKVLCVDEDVSVICDMGDGGTSEFEGKELLDLGPAGSKVIDVDWQEVK